MKIPLRAHRYTTFIGVNSLKVILLELKLFRIKNSHTPQGFTTENHSELHVFQF